MTGLALVTGGRTQIVRGGTRGPLALRPWRETTAPSPATGTQGAEYLATDNATPGQTKYLCAATNAWMQQAGGTSVFRQPGTSAVVRAVTSNLRDAVHAKGQTISTSE
jgi:hypothetical protein